MLEKLPKDCKNMKEIRAEIDYLDKHIISLIGKRAGYVHAAAAFKVSGTDVRAPERFASMLEQRREWAQENQLSPDMIEGLYRLMVEHFIEQEMSQWQQIKDK